MKTPSEHLHPGVTRRDLLGWAMYDFANSGYATVVLTAVFSAYFVGVVAANASWATLAATPFLYLFLYLPDPRVALVCYVPAAILGAMYLGPVFTYAQDCARPEQRALASAVLLFAINLIGLGTGPWIVGVLNELLSESQGALAVRTSLAIVSLTYVWGAAHMAYAARAR